MADFRKVLKRQSKKDLTDNKDVLAEGETLAQVVESENKEENKTENIKKSNRFLKKSKTESIDSGAENTESSENQEKKKIKLTKKQLAFVITASALLVAVAVFLILWFAVFDMGSRNNSAVYIDYEENTVLVSWDESDNAEEYIVEYYYRERTNLKTVTVSDKEIEIEREYGKLFVRVKPVGEDYNDRFWSAWYYTLLPPKEYKYNNPIIPYIVSKGGKIYFYLYFENLIVDGQELSNYTLTNQIDDGSVYVSNFTNELSVDFDINDDEAFFDAVDNGKLYSVSFTPPADGKTVLTVTVSPDFSSSEDLIEKYAGESVSFTVNFNWDKKTVMRAGTYYLASGDISVSNLENDIEII